jgi:hypothetical protein
MGESMRRWKYAPLVLVVAAGLLAGCGDDDDEETTAGDGATEDATDHSSFCAAFLELNQGESQPTADQIRDVAAMGPDTVKEPANAIADGFEEQGAEEFSSSEEFGQLYAEANEAAADECAGERITVTATEYQFDGIPSSLDAGIVAVDFDNEGGEFHEIAIARKKDGVDKTFDEILELEEDESMQYVDVAFGTFAPPGTSSVALLDLRETGEYLAVCFIPEGSTPENEEASGPPHFVHGMKHEFTVA